MSKITILSIFIALAFIGAGLLFVKANQNTVTNSSPVNNVFSLEGKQIIEINAKGGYAPKQTIANAETPTILKVKTQNTWDCSSSFRIPDLNYNTNLPSSGETLIEIPPQKAGTTLRGLCSMGMYTFTINFQS